MRMDIGRIMNFEMYICTYNQFKGSYLPKCDEETLEFVLECLKALGESPFSQILVPREEDERVDARSAGENDKTVSLDDKETEEVSERNEAEPAVLLAEGNEGDIGDCESEDVEQGYISDEEGEGDQGDERKGNSKPEIYSHVFRDFKNKPSLLKKGANANQNSKTSSSDKTKNPNIHEDKVFNPFGEIGLRILAALDKKGVKRNGYHLRMCPHTTIYSNVPGCNQEIDACLTKNKSKSLDIADILVPWELKLSYTIAQVFQNRRQLASQVNHTMNDDPRRKFMFGITIEDDRVSLWFFSRSHSVKAKSFSMVERPDLLVEVLVSLLCATDEQLGLDPLVHLTEDRRYVYEFPPTSTRPSPIYYRITETVSEFRWLRLICRATRIWKVIQVETPAHTEGIEGAKERILKDVCSVAEFLTESEIQHQLFGDIEAFAKDKEWRQREILQEFVEEDMATLGQALEGDFRRFFSCIIDEHIGEVTPPLCAGAWVATTPVFIEPQTKSQEHSKNRAAPGHRADPRPEVLQDEHVIVEEIDPSRAFVPRRQCRYIYEEVCTPLNDIPTLGEAVDIIQQCLIALRLMFCAGWVHRDISYGNILAYRPSPETQWHVKLSDLEYAKRFPSDAVASTIPKTVCLTFNLLVTNPGPSSDNLAQGTPYFMACEILTGKLITSAAAREPTLKRGGIRRNKVVNISIVFHTYQHDLESIWWILFWKITMRIKQVLPRAVPEQYFKNVISRAHASYRNDLFVSRQELAEDNDLCKSLPPTLKDSDFLYSLDALRNEFEVEYSNRNIAGKQREVGTYSVIISKAFWKFFEGIKDTRGEWGSLPLIVDADLRRAKMLLQKAPTATKRQFSELHPGLKGNMPAKSSAEPVKGVMTATHGSGSKRKCL
ncbi:other/FunK1 protein kinase, variant 2 [Coprinopsis cinerea AmutBmut pab1-1]|nr:other/FunK1 protein kinase, variant 2 [Coprinopsis cinerea AmutBmut pab1-1]